jgi:glutathione transport system ATP-binding protein
MYLDAPTSGEILFEGTEISSVFKSKDKEAILNLRQKIQYVFQNPYASLDPRMTVADIIMEPLVIHGHIPKDKWHDRLYELLQLVGLEGIMLKGIRTSSAGGNDKEFALQELWLWSQTCSSLMNQ